MLFNVELLSRILTLKISNIDVFQLGEKETGAATWAGNAILVKLTTSDGTVGWGEAVPTLRVQPVIQSIKEVARVYTGKDPLDVERNWHEWHRHDFYLPFSFESTTALSSFDIACWDIIGKHFGASLYQLNGGLFRERIRVYANGWYSNCNQPEDFAERAIELQKRGYTALKFDPFGNSYDSITPSELQVAYQRAKAVKEATEGKVEILIEHHGRFNADSAITIARKFMDLDPLFMEEPVHPESIQQLKKYRATTNLRIALGERIINKEHALQFLSEGIVDYLQADITNIGGVTQARKVASIAEAYGVQMAFHNAFGPIQNAVTLQLDASIPNFLIQESFYDSFPSWKRELIKDATPVVKGYAEVPKKAGLGVEIDEKTLDSHRAEGQESFNPEEPVWVVKGTWRYP